MKVDTTQFKVTAFNLLEKLPDTTVPVVARLMERLVSPEQLIRISAESMMERSKRLSSIGSNDVADRCQRDAWGQALGFRPWRTPQQQVTVALFGTENDI